MRTKNEKNVYSMICKVTGKSIPTNPKQFNDTANRYGVSDAILAGSYVSREGRNIIKGEQLTAEQAIAKYGLDSTIANALKCMVKPAAPAAESTGTEKVTVEVPANAVAADVVVESTETIDESVTAPVETEVPVAA